MPYQLITDGSVITQGPNLNTSLPTSFSLYGRDGDALIFGSPSVQTQIWINVSGVWKQATAYIKVSGVWKLVTPYIKVSGTWK